MRLTLFTFLSATLLLGTHASIAEDAPVTNHREAIDLGDEFRIRMFKEILLTYHPDKPKTKGKVLGQPILVTEVSKTVRVIDSVESYDHGITARLRAKILQNGYVQIEIGTNTLFIPPGNVEAIYRNRTYETTKAEQAGAGQPATRPQSKSEDSDKPQPESEGRSR